MEEGIPLKQKFERGQMSYLEFKKIAIELCEALIYLHNQNIIHCDIKPDNIIVINDPHASIGWRTKIIDFDTAIHAKDINDVQTICIGTKGFIAPEVTRGSYDYRCDIFSYGKTLN